MSQNLQSAMRRTKQPELPLWEGQRLTQPEFHRRYERCPPHIKAELIGGVVYMASPLRRRHGRHHLVLGTVLELYALETPGVEPLDNATTILGGKSEPQPDLAMRIHSAYGGQSRETEDDYVEGPPELLCEVADSSKAIDLRQKREDYEQAGVIEYLVLVVSKPELHWFHFPTQRNIRPNREGIAKSRVFPGLWIDVPALLARKVKQLIHVLQQGLASPQHAAFVKRLEAQRKRLEKHGR